MLLEFFFIRGIIFWILRLVFEIIILVKLLQNYTKLRLNEYLIMAGVFGASVINISSWLVFWYFANFNMSIAQSISLPHNAIIGTAQMIGSMFLVIHALRIHSRKLWIEVSISIPYILISLTIIIRSLIYPKLQSTLYYQVLLQSQAIWRNIIPILALIVSYGFLKTVKKDVDQRRSKILFLSGAMILLLNSVLNLYNRFIQEIQLYELFNQYIPVQPMLGAIGLAFFGLVALLYPTSLLLSHTQISRAHELYQIVKDNEPTHRFQPSIKNYLENPIVKQILLESQQ